MIPKIPYLQEILGGIILVLLIAVGVQTVRLSICSANLKAEAAERQNVTNMLELSRSTVVDLREKIEVQNEVIRRAAELGVQAQAEQDALLLLAERLAAAEGELATILHRNSELRELAEDMTTCETYELVLRSIAGSLP